MEKEYLEKLNETKLTKEDLKLIFDLVSEKVEG